jgi:SAM-dependent methyltransferase
MGKQYDQTIGYSPLEDVDEEKLLQLIMVNRKIIQVFYTPHHSDAILVAGAGQGQEAVLFGKEWKMDTFGVDLNIQKLKSFAETPNVYISRQDIASLSFPSEIFSLIYSYHVLEHVRDHLAVLNELKRVLKPGCVLFIGFPNKNRIVSYIGTSQKVSTLNRVKWNLTDYIYRLRGRFENKYGAHAGFIEKEFMNEATGMFRTVYPVRDEYMLQKYPRHARFIHLMIKSGMSEFIFPSNYFVCIK